MVYRFIGKWYVHVMPLVPDADEPCYPMPKGLQPPSALTKAFAKRNGRPPHVVTPVTQRLVRHWVAGGLFQDRIAKMMGISTDTLQKYYRYELDNGEDIANANVAANLYRIATGNSPSAAGAAQYWLNRRSEKFREAAKRVELTGRDGKPIEVQSAATFDPRKLSADEREALRSLLVKATQGEVIEAEYEDTDEERDEERDEYEEQEDGDYGSHDTDSTVRPDSISEGDATTDEGEPYDERGDREIGEEGAYLPFPEHRAFDPGEPDKGFD